MNTEMDLDATFMEMINASNIAFDVIIQEHALNYSDAFSQECEDILEEARKTVMITESIDSSLEDLAEIKTSPLFSRESLGELKHTVFVHKILKREAQEMVKRSLRKIKRARKMNRE